jgi:hypothetical protein
MNRESATFQLGTGGASSRFIRGTTSFTWVSFNLRDALGTMWGKYERYKIYCTEIVYVNNTTANNDKTLHFYLTGLDLEFPSYSYVNNKTTNEAFIGSVFQPFSGNNTLKQYPSTSGNVFRAPEEVINLTIQVKSGLTNAPPVAVSLASAVFAFQFIVYGIEEVPRLLRRANPQNYPLVLMSAYATKNANNTVMTFNNINLRDVIGRDYDNYDRFKLILTQYAMSNQGGIGSGVLGSFSILVEGLPFQNATYSIGNGVNTTNTNAIGMGLTNYWTATSVCLNATGAVPIFTQDYVGAVFAKYQDRVNLKMTICYMTGYLPRPETLGSSAFYFNIVGIED